MTFFNFLIKDLMKSKLRLALTVLGVTVGIAACVIMLGLSESIRGSFKNAYSKRCVDIIVYEKDNFDVISSKVPSSLEEELKSFPEVKNTAGMLADIERYGKGFLFVFGWPENSPHYENIEMVSGRPPAPGCYEAVIGSLLANRPDMKESRKICVKGKEFCITGVYNSESSFEKSALIMPIDVFQAVDRDKSGFLTGVNVMLKDGFRDEKNIRRVAEAIEKKHPEVTAQNAEVFIAEKTKQIIMGEKLSFLIVIIIITAVILGLANTMMTAVFEKRKLMGMLIAVGWQKKDVFYVVLLESLFIMLLGGALGTALGFFAIEHLFSVMDIAMFMPVWDYAFIGKVMIFIFLSGIAASLLPSWIIMNIDPVEVIRSE